MKKFIRKFVGKILIKLVPELSPILQRKVNIRELESWAHSTTFGTFTKVYPSYKINNCNIGNYTYIAPGSQINNTTIGKFCSIGPDFKCGWGVHPTTGISTSPMFYSTMKQNGTTLSKTDKIEEIKKIKIGNDVFIGRSVIVLDGIKIGNGAIIGAGAVVSKDIPDFAIAVGSPIKTVKYRFSEEQRKRLSKIRWWDFSEDKLKDVEKYFFDIDTFTDKYIK